MIHIIHNYHTSFSEMSTINMDGQFLKKIPVDGFKWKK